MEIIAEENLTAKICHLTKQYGVRVVLPDHDEVDADRATVLLKLFPFLDEDEDCDVLTTGWILLLFPTLAEAREVETRIATFIEEQWALEESDVCDEYDPEEYAQYAEEIGLALYDAGGDQLTLI